MLSSSGLILRASKVRNKGPKDIMAVEDLNGEVKFSTHLPYPNNLSRSERRDWKIPQNAHFSLHYAAVCRSLKLSGLCVESVWTRPLIVALQNAVGADGSAASADVEVGSRAARRQSQLRQQEASVLWGAGADTEHEGELLHVLSEDAALRGSLVQSFFKI